MKSVDVTVIGAGPAGLMAAEQAAIRGLSVSVFDAMPSAGRKLLRAGIGGLNLTHSEDKATFISRYGENAHIIGSWLDQFDAQSLRQWCHGLGIDTYAGSSGKVFPVGNKAAPLLRAWLARLESLGVELNTGHTWLGELAEGKNSFRVADGVVTVRTRHTILALGGGSWPGLGSTGKWLSDVQSQGIQCAPFRPSNCGFKYNWPVPVKEKAGEPVKTVALSVQDPSGNWLVKKGDAVISEQGIEGGLVYALSAQIRNDIDNNGQCRVYWDLAPDRTHEQLQRVLKKARPGDSVANVLRKHLGLSPGKMALVRALVSKEQMKDLNLLFSMVKRLPQVLTETMPIEKAISTAGGVRLEQLSADFSLTDRPSLSCVGEMLDWEAPTGGYLLTACFASGYIAGTAVAARLC